MAQSNHTALGQGLKLYTDAMRQLVYGQPKVLVKMGAVYFNSKLVPRLWKDDATPLELGELSRRFSQWTFLPILPNREETLRACIREGIGMGFWSVAIGDNTSLKYQKLIEKAYELDFAIALFDGSASLVKGELLEIVRADLGVEAPTVVGKPRPEPTEPREDGVTTPKPPQPPIPTPVKRHTRVHLRVTGLSIAKTSNLQPYLFKFLQEQDAAAELTVTVDVNSGAGISEEVLEQRIVEGLEQLGISVEWEAG